MKNKANAFKDPQEYCLLVYVLNSMPKIKKFDSKEKVKKFIDKFQKDHPEHMSMDSGDWIDYMVTGVKGEVFFFTDGMKVE